MKVTKRIIHSNEWAYFDTFRESHKNMYFIRWRKQYRYKDANGLLNSMLLQQWDNLTLCSIAWIKYFLCCVRRPAVVFIPLVVVVVAFVHSVLVLYIQYNHVSIHENAKKKCKHKYHLTVHRFAVFTPNITTKFNGIVCAWENHNFCCSCCCNSVPLSYSFYQVKRKLQWPCTVGYHGKGDSHRIQCHFQFTPKIKFSPSENVFYQEKAYFHMCRHSPWPTLYCIFDICFIPIYTNNELFRSRSKLLTYCGPLSLLMCHLWLWFRCEAPYYNSTTNAIITQQWICIVLVVCDLTHEIIANHHMNQVHGRIMPHFIHSGWQLLASVEQNAILHTNWMLGGTNPYYLASYIFDRV